MYTFLTLLFFIGAYLLGSISSAVLVSRFFSLPDPREDGSKNPGATNVLRLSGKKYASYVLVADILKGFIPVLLAKVVGLSPVAIAFVCFAAVLGHVFPLFLNFKGGKGMATAIGGLLAFHFLMGIVVIATWLIVLYLFRYSSLASIVTIVLMPFYFSIAVGSLNVFPPLFFIAILILFRHKDNINRLINGEESKITTSKSLADTLYQAEKKDKPE